MIIAKQKYKMVKHKDKELIIEILGVHPYQSIVKLIFPTGETTYFKEMNSDIENPEIYQLIGQGVLF